MARRISHAIGWLLMALQAVVITFALDPATGIQSVTGVGFEGTSLILLTTRQTAVGVTDGTILGIGVTDGTNQSCRSIRHPDNEAATTSGQLQQVADRLLRLASATSGATPTVQVDVAFDGFTANGFDLDILTTDGQPILCLALVLGGDSVQADGLNTPPINAGTVAVTGLGYSADAFLILGGTEGGSYNLGAPFGSMHGLGFSDGTVNHCSWALGRGTGGASDCNKGQRTDALYSIRTANLTGGGELARGRITAVGPDGYTITRDIGIVDAQPFVLSIKGVQIAIGTITQPAAGVQTLSLPFRARALLLQTHGATAGDNVAGYGLAIGAWAVNGQQASVWGGGTDDANPSVYARAFSDSRVLQVFEEDAVGADSTLVGEAEVTGVDTEGVELTWHTSDATARQILYCALSAVDADISCDGGIVPTVDDPDDGDTFEGLGPHEDRVFIETDLDDDEVARWALQTAMRDSPALVAHPGFKAGVITQIGSIIRRTTGRLGAWQASSVRWAKDDHDKVARDLFDRLHWYGREFRVYLAKRTSVATARILGRFFTSQYAPTQGFSAEVEGLDIVGSEFSPLALTRDIMAGAVFDRDRVPEAPVELLDQDPPQPIPIYMGRWSDEGSDEAPVSLIGAAWRKADPDVFWRMGFANMVSVGGIDPPPAPDDITLTLLSGGSIQVSPLSTRLCVQVWAVTDGVQGDPAPFLGRNKTVTITGNNRVKVDIDWSGPDPDTWRIGVGYIYFNERWTQVVEIAGTLRTFTLDNTPIFPDAGGGATTGGTQIGVFYDKHTYRVVKVTADGRTTATPLCHMNTGPYARPAHVSFQDVNPDSALRYEAYGTTKDPAGSPTAKEFIWRWTAPTDQIDSDGYHYILDHFDGTGRETLTEGMPAPQGILPVWDTGDVMFDGMLMGRLVMARWAWHRVISVYAGETRLADNHPDLRHADHPSWPQASRVVTLDDVDCMVLFVRVGSTILANHREGTAEIRVNACTTEDVGDGTGSTIAQSARAMRHLWERLVIQDHLSGSWIASPTFPDGTSMVRGSDFANAELMQIARVGGAGYPARIALIAPTSLGQFIQDGVQSYGLHHGIGWHGQIRCGHYDDAVDTTQGYPHFTHVRAIKGHLTIRPLTEDYENAIPSQWDFRPTTSEYAVKRTVPKDMVRDDAAIARNFGKRRVGPLRSLPYCANEQTYTDVMQRNLLLGRFVNEWIEVPTDITLGLTVDLFSIILVSDPEGTGANGYQETFVLVLEHEVVIGDPAQQRPTMVLLKGLNITKLIDAAWVWAPDDAPDTWDDLTDEQKGQYAGWADDDDEIPSTDDPAKEWR